MIIELLPDIEFSRCIAKIHVRSLSKEICNIQGNYPEKKTVPELLQLLCGSSDSDVRVDSDRVFRKFYDENVVSPGFMDIIFKKRLREFL